jgi:hypothetical protein
MELGLTQEEKTSLRKRLEAMSLNALGAFGVDAEDRLSCYQDRWDPGRGDLKYNETYRRLEDIRDIAEEVTFERQDNADENFIRRVLRGDLVSGR